MSDTQQTKAQASPLLTRLAKEIVDRSLTAPAIMFLESTKPLSFLGSQIMVFFSPFVKAFWDGASYDQLSALLEDRENIELLLGEIERLEAERATARKEEKARRKAEKALMKAQKKERRLWPKKRN
ncbi:MAG: hypothetical protein MUE60_03160 [Candidatus Eisenbacteria bacterium]|jgi:hypothetical protein|nr:hypothetical protein [Candidatus Eisenbacteria bacterium]